MAMMGATHDVPCASVATALKAEDLVKEVTRAELTLKWADGRKQKVHPSNHFKPIYKDEYTGGVLAVPQVHVAMID